MVEDGEHALASPTILRHGTGQVDIEKLERLVGRRHHVRTEGAARSFVLSARPAGLYRSRSDALLLRSIPYGALVYMAEVDVVVVGFHRVSGIGHEDCCHHAGRQLATGDR